MTTLSQRASWQVGPTLGDHLRSRDMHAHVASAINLFVLLVYAPIFYDQDPDPAAIEIVLTVMAFTSATLLMRFGWMIFPPEREPDDATPIPRRIMGLSFLLIGWIGTGVMLPYAAVALIKTLLIFV